MRRLTILTLILVVIATWISTFFLLVNHLPQGALELEPIFKSFGSALPRLSKPYLSYLLSPAAYLLPVLMSLMLALIEIFVKSERTRFTIQIVYTASWLVFVSLNSFAISSPCFCMLGYMK